MVRFLTFATTLCICAISIAQKIQDAAGAIPVVIDTAHIPATSTPLGLTTGELKLYSGHALNLVKSKCPNVNHHSLFKLHKYIGKILTKVEPTQGNNQIFKTLLLAMRECAADVRVASTKDIQSKNVEEPVVKTPAAPSAVVIEIGQGQVGNKEPEKPAIEDKKKWGQLTNAEKNQEITNLFKHFEPPIKAENAESPHKIINTPAPPTTTPKPKRGGVIGWLSSILESVSNFFRGLFGFGRRSRRSSESDEDTDEPHGAGVILTVWKPSEDISAEVKPIAGRQAFLTFFDEVCRIYCDICQTHKQISDFKTSARELLQFLFSEESSGLDLAAAHYLNHEFLQSVQECGMIIA